MLMILMQFQSVRIAHIFLHKKLHNDYPDELQKLHNDCPLPPEKLAIPYDMLSDYCKKIADEYVIKVGNVMKVVPNLGDKTKFVLHYRNL